MHARPRLALFALALVEFLVILDGLAVTVALPSLARDLGFARASLQWVVTAYALTFGGFLLLAGRAADIFGRRRVLLGGVLVFAFASLLGGLAGTPATLVVARALQGLGAAACAPSALALVAAIFAEGRARTRALALWSAIGSVGIVAGALLGGLVTGAFGWRWILLVNVPVGIAGAVLVRIVVPESRSKTPPRSFDATGAVTATGGLAALVYGAVALHQHGPGAASTLVAFAGSAMALALFVANEARAAEPLLRLGLLRRPTVVAANVGAFALNGGFAGLLFLTTLYVQQVLGYGAFEAGLAFVPLALGTIVGSLVAGRFVNRKQSAIAAVAGLGVTAAGLLLLAPAPVDGTFVLHVLPGTALAGLGVSVAYVPLTLAAVDGVAVDERGVASGLYHTTGQVGGAIVVAVLATIAAAAADDGFGFTAAFVAGAAVVALGGLASYAASRRAGEPARRRRPRTAG
jgi:EmrB/QacA subfamily drug resistance transporter